MTPSGASGVLFNINLILKVLLQEKKISLLGLEGHIMFKYFETTLKKNPVKLDLSGGAVAKTLCSQCK